VNPQDDVRRALGVAARALASDLGIGPDTDLLGDLLPLLADDGHPGTASPESVLASTAATLSGLGELHQSLLADGHRRQRGVHYTPDAVAETLVERALDGTDPDRPLICDPSCGGGVFLLAAARLLHRRGADPVDVVACLSGVDIDPTAVDVTRTALALWAASEGVGGAALRLLAKGLTESVVVADALREPWPCDGRLDIVVGNPPFGGQLGSTTVRDADSKEVARVVMGKPGGYTDTAGLFIIRALDAVQSGGLVVLVQPSSLLGARDAGTVRDLVIERGELEELWLAGEQFFGAAVHVCAPVIRRGSPDAHSGEPVAPTIVSTGIDRTVVAVIDGERFESIGSWGSAAAASVGVPLLDLSDRPRLSEWAETTAGFRDEFYALVPFVSDSDPAAPIVAGHPRIITSGLIEAARHSWGTKSTRIAGTRFNAPVLDVEALRSWCASDGIKSRVGPLIDLRCRPKLLVATQTRIVEVVVDNDGSNWPAVPVLSVHLHAEFDDDDRRWLVAAALMAPPASAWAAERSGGTALTPTALKLSARQLADMPMPRDMESWVEGAEHLRAVGSATSADDSRVRLLAAGRALTDAHRLEPTDADAVLRWWAARAKCADLLD
jgi:hypothetical protein